MKTIDGGNEPEANMHRREDPTCDLCGQPFRGVMPAPHWVSASYGKDEQGHPAPGSPIRMYLCKEHRTNLDEGIRKAYRRDRNRKYKGQAMFPELRRFKIAPAPVED